MAGKKSSKKYALLSVFDKTGIIEFAKELISLNYKIISTGGTAKVLSDAGLEIIPIQEITGNPESFDGRMKTISFQIESGILFDRKNKKHVKEAKNLKIKSIDIVVCNLYPFEQTISKPNVEMAEAIENIDVGGPTMVRAGAKNNKNVLIITDPKDYNLTANLLKQKKIDKKIRLKLAAKAFRHLSFY
ncbi:MAG: bifunctional phosphoribosylaminoimidazolecarboxamide formyltransferase/IMP cyclohydrolase, partial [Patescibacteria group bacterium]